MEVDTDAVMRMCKKCEQTMPLSGFAKNKNRWNEQGYRHVCKPCYSAHKKATRTDHSHGQTVDINLDRFKDIADDVIYDYRFVRMFGFSYYKAADWISEGYGLPIGLVQSWKLQQFENEPWHPDREE